MDYNNSNVILKQIKPRTSLESYSSSWYLN